MKLVKMTMMCVVLAPGLCWGGKFDGLLGVLSHARTPLVRMSQENAVRGVNPMGIQSRQLHGAAVLLKPAETDQFSSVSLPNRTRVTKESLDVELRRQTSENELLKMRLKNLEVRLQTEIQRNQEHEYRLSTIEIFGTSLGITAIGSIGLAVIGLGLDWFFN